MILHDVANDAEVIEVTAATLSPDVLLEGDDDAIDALAVPRRTENPVAETELTIGGGIYL